MTPKNTAVHTPKTSPLLPAAQFAAAFETLPLASIDLVRTDEAGRLQLGLPEAALRRTTLMGAWDHFYPDSAFAADVSTHYVNLALWLALTAEEVTALTLPEGDGEQHAGWQWMPLARAAADAGVHPHVQVHAAWVQGERRLAGPLAN